MGSIEPNVFGTKEEGLTIGVQGWPSGFPGQWNDAVYNNKLYPFIEYLGTAVSTEPEKPNEMGQGPGAIVLKVEDSSYPFPGPTPWVSGAEKPYYWSEADVIALEPTGNVADYWPEMNDVFYPFPSFAPWEEKPVMGGPLWASGTLSRVEENLWWPDDGFEEVALLNYDLPDSWFSPQGPLGVGSYNQSTGELMPTASPFDWSVAHLPNAWGVMDYLNGLPTVGRYPTPEWSTESVLAGGGFANPYLSEDGRQMLENYYSWQNNQFEDFYSSLQGYNDWMVDSWSQALSGDWG